MNYDNRVVYQDDHYTYEALLYLSTLRISDACREGRVGYHRLNRLWKEAGIVRKTHNGHQGGSRSPLDAVPNDRLVELRKSCCVQEIAKMLDCKPETIRRLYRKRELKMPKEDNGTARLPGTKEPVKCHVRGCDRCKHLGDCRQRDSLGQPLLGEVLTEDDPFYYVKEVWEAVACGVE